MLFIYVYNVLGCYLHNRISFSSFWKSIIYVSLKELKVKKDFSGGDMWFYIFREGLVMEWEVKIVLNYWGLTMSVGFDFSGSLEKGCTLNLGREVGNPFIFDPFCVPFSWQLPIFEILLIRILQLWSLANR